VSLHALTSLCGANTMQLLVHIGGKQLCSLVDSGSTHSCMHEAVVHMLGLNVTHRPGLSVKVANRERLQSYDICRATTVHIQAEQLVMDCYTLPLKGFDVILGVQWLISLGPIVWDFAALSVTFLHNGHSVRLHGCGGSPSMLCSISQQDDLLASLLNVYANIFEEPHGLPPQCRHDHCIHLLPRTSLVVMRLYHYWQLLKDEVEWQCTDILMQGTIQPSTLPFSSPMLSVKKADKSWWFCVDYRTLNEKTVKDKFLILAVDELLDKLCGARFFTKIDLHSGYHQVRMYPDNIEKMTFRTHQSHFEFIVMSFGWTHRQHSNPQWMASWMPPFTGLCWFSLLIIWSIVLHGQNICSTPRWSSISYVNIGYMSTDPSAALAAR
jgi:hypothetical protein